MFFPPFITEIHILALYVSTFGAANLALMNVILLFAYVIYFDPFLEFYRGVGGVGIACMGRSVWARLSI